MSGQSPSIELRALRVWHWSKVIAATEERTKMLGLAGAESKPAKRDQFRHQAEMARNEHAVHLAAVQALNDYFPDSDYAEQDVDGFNFHAGTLPTLMPGTKFEAVIKREFETKPAALRDDQVRDIVGMVTAVARVYHGHQSLRERMADVLVPVLNAPLAGV